jgi:serine O-acetyltransferase
MSKESRLAINEDLFRYYGKSRKKSRLFCPLEIKYLILLRKLHYAKSNFIRIYYKLRLQKMSRKTHIQIPYDATIGRGFYIGHLGTIVINSAVVMGDNINIATGVTIGQTNRGAKKGCPTIGNDVWIGTNAVIVGKVNIGNDVLIAPNAYVNTDVPNHSLVIGNPATIHHKENATADYIFNRI